VKSKNNNFNVLLISIDAFGADKCWGLQDVYLPNIEMLGKQGVSFQKVISTTSSTTPSMASILTGLYPKDHGITSTYGEKLNIGIQTLPEILRDNGYNTSASVGGPLMRKTGINIGFKQYSYYEPWLKVPIYNRKIVFNRSLINNFLINRELKNVINNSKPWFHWLHLLDLHNRWRKKLYFKKITYKQALKNLDKKLGSIFKMIDFENTIIILTADHGHYVRGIDGKYCDISYPEAHGFNISDLLVNVPLIIASPNISNHGLKIKNQVSSRSIFPTILDLVNIENPSLKVPKSLLDLINLDSFVLSENPIYIEACGSILKRQKKSFLHGIRYKNYKYVITKNNNYKEAQLYDLVNDPQEKINIYHQNDKIAKKMHSILDKIIK